MTDMLGHPVAENPIDRLFDAVYAHYGLCWQFWKNDITSTADLALAVQALAWCPWATAAWPSPCPKRWR
jgi:shikimate dehydrogenase